MTKETAKSAARKAGKPEKKEFEVPKKLEQMRENPVGDWSISDIGAICKKIGMELKPPKRGSHYKVYSELTLGPLTIPARRPLKVVYIKEFLKLCDAHIAKLSEE